MKMDLFSEAIKIVLEAGRQLTERKGIDDISEKGPTDYVTAVDIRVMGPQISFMIFSIV